MQLKKNLNYETVYLIIKNIIIVNHSGCSSRFQYYRKERVNEQDDKKAIRKWQETEKKLRVASARNVGHK